MTNYVCRYPDGAAGLGLLLIRICHAPAACGIAVSADAFDPYVRDPAAGLMALLLAIGFATRSTALLLGILTVVAVPGSDPVELWLLAGHLGACAGLVLLGAGAYSVDARLHGRRVIHLHATTPDRGVDD
jgi:putative oxidoreductase